MIFHLLLVVMLASGPEFSVSGPLSSVEDCRARAKVIVNAYPRGAVRAVEGHCVPGHQA